MTINNENKRVDLLFKKIRENTKAFNSSKLQKQIETGNQGGVEKFLRNPIHKEQKNLKFSYKI